MKLTAAEAYRVTSSRYAASEPPSASLASSASLGGTDTRYTASPAGEFQNPNPKFQIPKPNSGFGVWDLGLGIYLRFQDFVERRSNQARRVVGGFVGDRQAVKIPLGVDGGHAAGTGGGNRLPIDVVLHVAGGKHPGHGRLRTVVRDDIAGF